MAGYGVIPIDSQSLLFQAAWDNSAEGMRATDAEGRIVAVNEAFCRLMEMRQDDLVGQPFTVAYNEPDREHMLSAYRRRFQERSMSAGLDRQIRLRNGRSVHVALTNSFIESVEGEPLLLSIYRDVTEQRKAELELESRVRQQAVVSRLGQLALAVDDIQVLLQQAVAHVAGTLDVEYSAVLELEPDQEWLIMRASMGFGDIADRERTAAKPTTQCGYVLATRRPLIVEDQGSDTRFIDSGLLYQQEAASGIHVLIPGAPRPYGVLGAQSRLPHHFTRDDVHFLQAVANVLAAAIARARACEQLRELAQALREKNDDLTGALSAAREATMLKGRFLANISHEIRTPINGIMGMTELLLATPLSDEQREYATLTRTSTEALMGVINDIVDFSKIEAGKLELEMSPFDPVGVLRNVVSLLGARAQSKGLVLDCVVSRDMPRAVRGDAGRLRQVLLNVIGNAIKFTAQGEVKVDVQVEAAGAGRTTLRFRVRDTGIGIPPEHKDQLFQSFAQGDGSWARKHGGAGLGLAISSRLVALMGGAMGVESVPGSGSTFWFTVQLENHVESAPAPARAEAPSRDHRPGPRRILLAEDNPVNRTVAVKLLKHAGFAVDAVANGKQAVEALEIRRYDLVLMDVQMPEMDGLEATARIREMESDNLHTPIVAMTANALGKDRDVCLSAGMDDYLSKPIRSEELWAAVNRWIEKRDPGDKGGLALLPSTPAIGFA